MVTNTETNKKRNVLMLQRTRAFPRARLEKDNSLEGNQPYARIEFEAWRNDQGTRTLYLGELSVAVVHYATDIDKEHVDRLIKAANSHDALYDALKAIRDVAAPILRDTDNPNTFAMWASKQADAALSLVDKP